MYFYTNLNLFLFKNATKKTKKSCLFLLLLSFFISSLHTKNNMKSAAQLSVKFNECKQTKNIILNLCVRKYNMRNQVHKIKSTTQSHN